MKGEKIYFVTNGFPFDRSEDPFIIPELTELVKYYHVVIIACTRAENVTLEERDIAQLIGKEIPVYRYQIKRKKNYEKLRSCFICLHPVFLKELFNVLKTRKYLLKRMFSCYLFFTQSEEFFCWMRKERIINQDSKGFFYTYWNIYYCLHIGIKRKHYPKIKLISRLHKYDLYDYVTEEQWQPFKKIIDKSYDRLVFISEHGKNYYCEHYQGNTLDSKYQVCMLGVMRQKENLVKSNRPFLLVSCSSIYPLKRVPLIIEGLEKIQDIQIKWVHFGTGDDSEEVNDLAEKKLRPKKNIEFELQGQMPNHDILKYYQTYYPTCIINVSEAEGSPVSLHEAIAFGTPVIATKVEGNTELVEQNGILLPANPTPTQVANAIQSMAEMPYQEYVQMRQCSYELWEKKLNREQNTERFLNLLEEI